MEEGVFAEGVGIGFEVSAALLDALLDIGQAVEVAVGDGFIDELPEMLGGLQFGRVGRQVDQP